MTPRCLCSPHQIADENNVDSEALNILKEAIRQSHQQRRPLQVVADEILKNTKFHESEEPIMLAPPVDIDQKGLIIVEDRKRVQLRHAWPSILRAAYASHLERLGVKAEHDREALETLHAWVHEACDLPLEPGFDGGGGISLRPPPLASRETGKLLAVDGSGFAGRELVQRPSGRKDYLPKFVIQAAAKLVQEEGQRKPALQEIVEALRQALEDYSVLPSPVSGVLMAEYTRRNGGARAPTEKQQVELLEIFALNRVMEDGPNGVKVRPPRLGPPPALQHKEAQITEVEDAPLAPKSPDNDESNVITDAPLRKSGGGVRAHPPKLLSFDARQGEKNIGEQELQALAQVSLECKVKPIEEGMCGGGGVKLRPPFLKPPPGRRTATTRDDRVIEEQQLDEGADGGGGTCVHPPKLLCAEAKTEEDTLVGDQHSAPTPEVNDDELMAIAMEAQQAPLEKDGEGGGGVRLPPPRLKPAPEVIPAYLDAVSPAVNEDGIPSAEDPSDRLQALSEADIIDDYVGGGARLPPPKLLQLNGDELDDHGEPIPEESEPELEALESAVVDQKGGGARLPPPHLQPISVPATWGAQEVTDEVLLCPELPEPVPNAGWQPTADEWKLLTEDMLTPRHILPEMDLAKQMDLAEPVDDEETGLTPVEMAELDDGDHGGGGLRLSPPKLLPPLIQAEGVETTPDADILMVDLDTLEEAPVKPGGGGARVPPPILHPVVEMRTDTLDSTAVQPLEEKPLAQSEGDEGLDEDTGGGVRLPPPQLLPVGQQASLDAFGSDSFPDHAARSRPSDLGHGLVGRDALSSLPQDDSEFLPASHEPDQVDETGDGNEEHVTTADITAAFECALEEAPLRAQDEGGGVRLPPPYLFNCEAPPASEMFDEPIIKLNESNLSATDDGDGGGVRLMPPALTPIVMHEPGVPFSENEARDLKKLADFGPNADPFFGEDEASQDQLQPVEATAETMEQSAQDSSAQEDTPCSQAEDSYVEASRSVDQLKTYRVKGSIILKEQSLEAGWGGGGGIRVAPSSLDEQKAGAQMALHLAPAGDGMSAFQRRARDQQQEAAQRDGMLYRQGSEAEPEEVIHLESDPAHRTPSVETVEREESQATALKQSSKRRLLASDSNLKELREKAPRSSARKSVAGKKRSVGDQSAGYVHPPIEDSEVEPGWDGGGGSRVLPIVLGTRGGEPSGGAVPSSPPPSPPYEPLPMASSRRLAPVAHASRAFISPSRLPGAPPLPPGLPAIDDDDGIDLQVPPTTMPETIRVTLEAEAQRSAEATDAQALAELLVERYARASAVSDTWGRVTGFGKRKKIKAVLTIAEAARQHGNRSRVAPDRDAAPAVPVPKEDVVRRQMVSDALMVAVDGAKADGRVLQPGKHANPGVVDLPSSVEDTIAALRQELDETTSKIRLCPPNPCNFGQIDLYADEESQPKKLKDIWASSLPVPTAGGVGVVVGGGSKKSAKVAPSTEAPAARTEWPSTPRTALYDTDKFVDVHTAAECGRGAQMSPSCASSNFPECRVDRVGRNGTTA